MMKKRVIRFTVFILILALLLSMTAFAAMDASDYLSYYNAYITRSGDTVEVNFYVIGTGIMDNIGVTGICLYEKTSPNGNWVPVKTYLYTDQAYATAMMSSDTSYKDDYVTYAGNSSYQYKAYVTVYAEKNGGSDSRSFIAN